MSCSSSKALTHAAIDYSSSLSVSLRSPLQDPCPPPAFRPILILLGWHPRYCVSCSSVPEEPATTQKSTPRRFACWFSLSDFSPGPLSLRLHWNNLSIIGTPHRCYRDRRAKSQTHPCSRVTIVQWIHRQQRLQTATSKRRWRGQRLFCGSRPVSAHFALSRSEQRRIKGMAHLRTL